MRELLTDKEQRFIEAFERLQDYTKAADEAGYAAPRVAAGRLRRSLKLQRELEKRRMVREGIGNGEQVVNPVDRDELILYFSMTIRDPTVPHTVRMRAGELLAKMCAWFVDKIQMSGVDNGPLLVDVRFVGKKDS